LIACKNDVINLCAKIFTMSESGAISKNRWRFHHIGIPTEVIHPYERYSDHFKMFTSDRPGILKAQFHRFEEDSPLPALARELPHIALQVDDLASAIKGLKVILGPYEPIKDYKVAIIDDNGLPLELIETTLSDEELWAKASAQKDLEVSGLS